MKRILTLMFVALTVIAANAQDTKSLELTAADMNINVTFYSPEIIRVTKAPLGSNSPKKKAR